MRKFLLPWIFILLLAGCSQDATDNYQADEPLPPAEATDVQGDFTYRLHTEKDVYETYGDTAIFAELTYTGELDEIKISYAASPFYFPLEETTRGITVDYAMNTPENHLILKKDEPYQERYDFAGGYSDQDAPEYVEFVKSIMEKGINSGDYKFHGFPEGIYLIHGFAEFSVIHPGAEKEEMHLEETIGFRVTPPITE